MDCSCFVNIRQYATIHEVVTDKIATTAKRNKDVFISNTGMHDTHNTIILNTMHGIRTFLQ